MGYKVQTYLSDHQLFVLDRLDNIKLESNSKSNSSNVHMESPTQIAQRNIFKPRRTTTVRKQIRKTQVRFNNLLRIPFYRKTIELIPIALFPMNWKHRSTQ